MMTSRLLPLGISRLSSLSSRQFFSESTPTIFSITAHSEPSEKIKSWAERNNLTPKNRSAFNTLLNTLGKKTQNPKSLEELFETYRNLLALGFQPDHVTIRILLEALARAGTPNTEYRQMYQELAKTPRPVRTHDLVVLAKNGDIQGIKDTFENLHPSPKHYSIIIETFANSGQPKEALRYETLMKEAGHQHTIPSLFAVASAHAELKDKESLNLVYQLLEQDHPFTTREVNLALKVFAANGQTQEMLRWRSYLEDTGQSPDSRTFLYLFEGFARNGKMEEAVNWLLHLEKNRLSLAPIDFNRFKRIVTELNLQDQLPADIVKEPVIKPFPRGDMKERLRKYRCSLIEVKASLHPGVPNTDIIKVSDRFLESIKTEYDPLVDGVILNRLLAHLFNRRDPKSPKHHPRASKLYHELYLRALEGNLNLSLQNLKTILFVAQKDEIKKVMEFVESRLSRREALEVLNGLIEQLDISERAAQVSKGYLANAILRTFKWSTPAAIEHAQKDLPFPSTKNPLLPKVLKWVGQHLQTPRSPNPKPKPKPNETE